MMILLYTIGFLYMVISAVCAWAWSSVPDIIPNDTWKHIFAIVIASYIFPITLLAGTVLKKNSSDSDNSK